MTEIEMIQEVINSFERSIEKLKSQPKTKKRLAYISELEGRIRYQRERIKVIEIMNG